MCSGLVSCGEQPAARRACRCFRSGGLCLCPRTRHLVGAPMMRVVEPKVCAQLTAWAAEVIRQYGALPYRLRKLSL